jgi:hypothetical protein
MIKKILILIIFSIIVYEIYLQNNFYKDNSDEYEETDKVETLSNVDSNDNSNDELTNFNHQYSSINSNENLEIDQILDINDDKNRNKNIITVDLFGSPSDYENNNFILWEFVKPWTKIIYNYNEKLPFYFYIKVRIPSLNDYNNWKEIYPPLDFNPKTGEIIINTNDEETALSIANLIIINFRGDITIEEIIKRNLIEISINKSKKYEVVKNKIKESLSSSNEIKPIIEEKTPEFEKDLATNQYSAYEGSEYSFF